MVLTKSANVGDMVTPFSSAPDAQGRGGDDGRHGARSRSRPTSPSRNLSKIKVGQPARDPARRLARRCASAAA
ncbi:MAG: hypothetical protein MZW92_38410 [Comamonadaceae bacterium]|nr:hypothetical protein [Comamonadaceae bacterium]